ncbi:MAG TPA: hypothetical protein VIN34_11100 [Candidatus Limnocylindria bacterium]|jgi:hypothetical protein
MNLVEAEALSTLQLKGFHKPMVAYNVVGLRSNDRPAVVGAAQPQEPTA